MQIRVIFALPLFPLVPPPLVPWAAARRLPLDPTQVQNNLARGRIAFCQCHPITSKSGEWIRRSLVTHLMVPMTHNESALKRHLDWFSRFCTAHQWRNYELGGP